MRRKFKKKTSPLVMVLDTMLFYHPVALPRLSWGLKSNMAGLKKASRTHSPALLADYTHTLTFLLRRKRHLGRAKNSAPSPHPKGRKPVMAHTRKGHITVSQGLCSVPAENGTSGFQLLFLGKHVHRAQTWLLKSVKARALLKPCRLQLIIF